MRILFAAPDRDLLECYKIILESDFGETVTAFDGAQVSSLLSSEEFDLVILDRDIPRIGYKKLIERVHERKTPVIVLTDEIIRVSRLTESPLPNAYISYPFSPDMMRDVIKDVLGKASSGERMMVGRHEINVPGFRITGGPRLTAKEIDVLHSLLTGSPVTTGDGACISALNAKLAGVGSEMTIKYRQKKGFELVTRDE